MMHVALRISAKSMIKAGDHEGTDTHRAARALFGPVGSPRSSTIDIHVYTLVIDGVVVAHRGAGSAERLSVFVRVPAVCSVSQQSAECRERSLSIGTRSSTSTY